MQEGITGTRGKWKLVRNKQERSGTRRLVGRCSQLAFMIQWLLRIGVSTSLKEQGPDKHKQHLVPVTMSLWLSGTPDPNLAKQIFSCRTHK